VVVDYRIRLGDAREVELRVGLDQKGRELIKLPELRLRQLDPDLQRSRFQLVQW
jgi:hypothetical protein